MNPQQKEYIRQISLRYGHPIKDCEDLFKSLQNVKKEDK